MTEPTTTQLARQTEKPKPTPTDEKPTSLERVHLPRISIKFCTQCRWMLRAAYFAQELLSTFNTDLGEVALVPMTGGVFTVTIWHAENLNSNSDSKDVETKEIILWDRKRDGGFPEVKALKSLVRNVIAPERDLGHTDRALKKEQDEKVEKLKKEDEKPDSEQKGESGKKECEDCI
ncbi:hypothetical protein N7478_004096 [Penicillium angulare]|uniref:uncharacterized protein n=1 Tax=Penicillium angulare TaxID=116970 RepID=UPI00253FDA50|nr:uncharacterized protein N7478_004096 [Penicillium angulare]KAJ5278724.1 hypothetical protein N7478_004096 [Penicillium angulare]